jgi:hypothetical protein
MEHCQTFDRTSLRRLVLALALLLGSFTALSSPASAATNIPLADAGGLGGGGLATVATTVTVAFDTDASINFCIGCVRDEAA